MWKPEHRRAASQHSARCPSDLSDAEWVLVAPMIPPARRGGRRRSVDVREVLSAIFYVPSTGCQWKAMPKDLPPKSTAHFYFMLWGWDGTFDRIHDVLWGGNHEQEIFPCCLRSNSLILREIFPVTATRRFANKACGAEVSLLEAP